MTTELEQATSDVPLGVVGRMLGLRVVPPEIEPGERLEWSARANRMQGMRAVGGRLFLTDRRLVFARTRFESVFGGKVWSAELGELTSASAAGWRKMEVARGDGEAERFVVRSPEESAEIVDRAIRGAAG